MEQVSAKSVFNSEMHARHAAVASEIDVSMTFQYSLENVASFEGEYASITMMV